MGRKTIRDEYFSWLYARIADPKRSYKVLCSELHKKTFRWSVHNDDNRCEDGLDLRDDFFTEHHLDESHLEIAYWLREGCTVFEVLVALAKRMNDITYNLDTQADQTAKWFHELIRNLGLWEYDDRWEFTPISEAKVDEILESWMDRTYDFYGKGSLFPLKRRPKQDMTTVEIWYQLMLYLDENYGL